MYICAVQYVSRINVLFAHLLPALKENLETLKILVCVIFMWLSQKCNKLPTGTCTRRRSIKEPHT